MLYENGAEEGKRLGIRVLNAEAVNIRLSGSVSTLQEEEITLKEKLKEKKRAAVLSGSCWSATAMVSAYSSTPDQTWGDPFTTRSSTRVHWGTMAVDPNVMPLWSDIHVPGYGWGVAEDIGGAVVGLHVDVWMPSRQDARNWGIRWLKIMVCPP